MRRMYLEQGRNGQKIQVFLSDGQSLHIVIIVQQIDDGEFHFVGKVRPGCHCAGSAEWASACVVDEERRGWWRMRRRQRGRVLMGPVTIM